MGGERNGLCCIMKMNIDNKINYMNIFVFQIIIGLIPFIAYTESEIDEPSDWSYLLLLDA